MSRLYDSLREYSAKDYYPYHMPGHKRRMEGAEGLPYAIDITEIDGFDNLHHAEGILRDAQERAARLWGADRSFFLINGSTCGILSILCAAARLGHTFLMARNCHKSAYHGIYLSGADVRYLYPPRARAHGQRPPGMNSQTAPGTVCDAACDGRERPEMEFAGPLPPESVEEALRRCRRENRPVAGVFLTSPTYEGIVSDITAIAQICHAYGTPLIVDEAHGAHFGFAAGYPDTALHQGADAVVQSVHKTLPALTQTALLHLAGDRIDPKRVERFLSVYQTSSPSYVLMGSIDVCMDIVEREGRARLEERLEDLRWFRGASADLRTISPFFQPDPLKIVISVCGSEMTGKQIYDILLKEHHLQLEMAAGSYCLAMFSMMDTREGYARLCRALHDIDGRNRKAAREGREASADSSADARMRARSWPHPDASADGYAQAEPVCSLREAYDAPAEYVPLERAVGRVAGGFVSLYPPGIPLIVPGERVSAPFAERIRDSLRQGLQVTGLQEGGRIAVADICPDKTPARNN